MDVSTYLTWKYATNAKFGVFKITVRVVLVERDAVRVALPMSLDR